MVEGGNGVQSRSTWLARLEMALFQGPSFLTIPFPAHELTWTGLHFLIHSCSGWPPTLQHAYITHPPTLFPSTLKSEVASSFETLVSVYKTTWYHNPNDHNQNDDTFFCGTFEVLCNMLHQQQSCQILCIHKFMSHTLLFFTIPLKRTNSRLSCLPWQLWHKSTVYNKNYELETVNYWTVTNIPTSVTEHYFLPHFSKMHQTWYKYT
jgi:hypothetical protein